MSRPLALTRALLLAATIVIGACGDSRLRKLKVGIAKDSVLTVMGGKPERTDAYLTNGQLIEAMLYGKRGADSGTTPERKLSPVVVINGHVTGWGWGKWEAVAAQYHIQLKR